MGAASGKIDAFIFILGMVGGIWGFAELYPMIYDFAWSGYMGAVTLPGLFGVSSWVMALIALFMALVLFWVAAVVER